MLVLTCAYCCPAAQNEKRKPLRSTDSTVHGAGALNAKRLEDDGYAVVRPHKGRKNCGTNRLNKSTTFVHITGTPYLWLIEQILQQAPNLKTIQVLPTFLRMIHPDSHLRLCQGRGVTIVSGHHRPELAWPDDSGPRSAHYKPQRDFLQNLQGEQRILFDELRALDIEAADMTVRYFALDNYEYSPQRVLAEEYGFSKGVEHFVSAKINAVLFYLDPAFPTGTRSKRIAQTIRERVIRLRLHLQLVGSRLQVAEARNTLAKRLGVSLSDKFPLARADIFEALLEAERDGRLAQLGDERTNAHRALTLRFGFDDLSTGVYRTLTEVGELMGGITRERVRQLEAEALERLNISDD